jgi:hypothetical protein
MFAFLIDTSVWLDLAKDPRQQTLLGVLEELVKLKEVSLLVPRIVLDEFHRNKARVVEESCRSVSSVFKRVKELVEKFGDSKKKAAALEQLNDVDHKIPLLGESAVGSVARIEALFDGATIIEATDDVKLRAAQRAIEGKAPFHRQRNEMGDAIIIETYGQCVQSGDFRGHRLALLTHNKGDFSDPTGSDKTPHPDIAAYFSKRKSLYFISLAEAIKKLNPDLVSDLMLEQEWNQEPRPLSEILDALEESLDKVWYNRHKVFEAEVLSGQRKIVEKETFPVKDHRSRPVQRDVWEGARKAAKRVEQKYGKKNLGPWSNFEWGMLNGKLSALRWVLGDEWDMLDT